MERLFECGYISTPERVIFLERLWLVREIKPASTHLHTTYVLNRKTGNYQSEPENKKVAIQDLRATLVEEHCLLTFLSAVAKSCLCVSVCLSVYLSVCYQCLSGSLKHQLSSMQQKQLCPIKSESMLPPQYEPKITRLWWLCLYF